MPVLAELFLFPEMAAQEPRYNIAPTQEVAAVRSAAGGPQRELVFFRWGLIPGWADDPGIGNRLINARAETAAEKPSFRSAFRQRRCLILADGFFEWQKLAGRKQPHYFRLRDGQAFAFAGLWECWQGEGRPVESCTILTTQANELVRPLHERMPVILPPEDHGRWLDLAATKPELLEGLLRPYRSEDMVSYPVNLVVNNPRNNSPQCIEPAA